MSQRGAIWTVAGPLIAFKVWACILLLIYAPNRDGIVWIAITSWYWVLAIILLIAAPVLAWSRLVRVRARRQQLRRAEWMVDESTHAEMPAHSARRPQWSLWETVSRLEGDD